MSSFKFNFSRDDVNSDAVEKQIVQETKEKEIQWLKSIEVVPNTQKDNLNNITARAKLFTCGDVEIGHVIAKEALVGMRNNDLHNSVELAEKEHSDLVTGKYEGGLKIWECTYDLIEYLMEAEPKLLFKNLNVLDLGCGTGILGIYALMNGANVTFQDYNKEVLECVTIPNVMLNAEEEDIDYEITKCKFYSGDWTSFNQKLPDTEVYDIILTSETIYNPDNYKKLIELFLHRLAKDGTVYVAAKTCYFGVGGGTRQFEKSLEKNTILNSEISWKSTGGIQREIIKITKKA